jgi:hypothetical protein
MISKEDLDLLRSKIKKTELRLLELFKQLKQDREQIAQDEAKIMKEVAEETDPQTLKFKYSNQDKRDAEVRIRLQDLPAHNLIKMNRDDTENRIEQTKIELQDMKYEFRSWEITARLTD